MTTAGTAATKAAPTRRSRGARIFDGVAFGMRTVGELAMTLGVLILLFIAYELYFTGVHTAQAQHRLQNTFRQQVEQHVTPSTAPALGSGIAEMYAPALGSRSDWHFVIVEGTGEDQLADGPGHFEYDAATAAALGISKPLANGLTPSAFPGQVGNFVVSGHRVTHAHPFFNAARFKPGDALIFETSTTWYVYRVVGTASVLPTDVAVAYPVPDTPHATPTQKLVTLTTCNPPYSATHRLIIRGVLAYSQPLSAGDPRAFATGRA